MLLEMNVKLRRGHLDLTTQLSISDASVGLFGKSGAGKSTVLGLIAGTIQPQSGQIVLDGKILYDSRKGIVMPREQRPVGAVLQVDCAYSAETVRDNLTAVFNRTLKHRRIFKLDFLIGLLELEPILDHPIALLSAGEHQRVALARSLLKSPRLLLLDETFAAIGNGYRIQLLPILKRLQNELGLPVLYASQSLGEILGLTDRLIVLEQGKVLHNGLLLEIAKQQGMLRYLGIRQIDNILSVTIRSHDYFVRLQPGPQLRSTADLTATAGFSGWQPDPSVDTRQRHCAIAQLYQRHIDTKSNQGPNLRADSQRRKPDRTSRLRWHAAGRNYAGSLPEHGLAGRRGHLLPDQNPFHYLPRRA